MIVDVLHDPENLRAALGVKGRPRPQARATRDAEPPYDVHLELVDEDDEA